MKKKKENKKKNNFLENRYRIFRKKKKRNLTGKEIKYQKIQVAWQVREKSGDF